MSKIGAWVKLGPEENDPPMCRDYYGDIQIKGAWDLDHVAIGLATEELERIPYVAAIIAERDALRKRVQELEEANKPQGWTYSSLTNAYLGIPEGIGPSARTSMTQPLPPSEEISDG